MPHKETLVVVFDGAKARFLRRTVDGRLFSQEEMDAGLHHFTRDAVSDKPGRSFSSASPGRRGALEPKHDEHKMEKRNFLQSVVHALQDAHNKGRFERLIVVAPERSIGEFRSIAPEGLQKLVIHEVKKELMHLPTDELEDRLTAEMKVEPAR